MASPSRRAASGGADRAAVRPRERRATRVRRAVLTLTGTTLACAVLAACSSTGVARVEADVTAGVARPGATVSTSVTPSQGAAHPLAPFSANPFDEGKPHLGRWSAAADASESVTDPDEKDLLLRLAQVPTATWLVPEAHPLGEVGHVVGDLVQDATTLGEVAVLVVYGAPRRDCEHGHSQGGLPPEQYLEWVREISDAAGPRAVVILEPDALASAGACRLEHDRLELLADAVGLLAEGPVTYVDAGHSRWQSAATMVERLRSVGVERVRGFSLGVSNYGDEAGERAYGERISAALGKASFVVDTGRAGNGAGDTWCNPRGRALGARPATVSEGPYDARLWVKVPGESDGTCGGGPPAGEFWVENAVTLARAAGW